MSLRAKLGLPRGNQIVGWLVLGMEIPAVLEIQSLIDNSIIPAHAICTPTTTE
jgi:hypothetical protein